MRKLLLLLLLASPVWATDYWIAASGSSDSNNGLSSGAPWATFAHAWTVMGPGDSLTLRDGNYTQLVCPTSSGTSIARITIQAENDGQAIIDGQSTEPYPISLGGACAGYANIQYITIKGLVAKNAGVSSGTSAVIMVYSNNNIFQRVSAYNANKDYNTTVIDFMGSDNLCEDCVAGGYGRKMYIIYHGDATVPRRNILRRCFSAWMEWQGAQFDPGGWPWGDGLEVYGASSNIVENSITYGMAPGPSAGMGSNNQGASAVQNLGFYGDMVIRAGMKYDGTSMTWPCPSPYREGVGCMILADVRAGFNLAAGGVGDYNAVTWQDFLSWGNGGKGLDTYIGGNTNFSMIRGTIANNAHGSGDDGVDVTAGVIAQLDTITDTFIDGTAYAGSGARLIYRYESGFTDDVPVPNLTSTPLWPWPMEARINAEFASIMYPVWGATNPELEDFSVTTTMQGIFDTLGAQNPNPGGGAPSGTGQIQGNFKAQGKVKFQ
jgi:hypothetical protein